MMRTISAEGRVLALTSAAALTIMLDMLVVTTALGTIRTDLGASIETLEWTVNAFTLAFAVLLMPASALGDRHGRRRVLTAGLAVFTLASVACALAPGTGLLIAARAVQGAGSAMVMPHAMALLSAAYPAQRRARALGTFSGVTGLATLGGPLVGGAIVDGLAWQWIFWLNVPLGLALIPLVRAFVPESRGAARRTDPGGVLLVTGGALGLVWGLVRGNAAGWNSPEVLGALIAGAVLGAAFVLWERRAAEPMLPMRYFRVPAFAAGNAAGFLLYGAIFGAAFFFAQFLQIGLGHDPLGTGLRLAPWTVTLFLIAPLAGGLVARFGERPLIAGGMLLEAAGFGWIALIASPDMHYAAMVPPLVLAGIGVSLAMPAAQNAVIGAIPAVGVASGTFNTLRQLGGTFGIAVAAAVFASSGGYGSPRAFADGFTAATGVLALLALAAALAGLGTSGRRVPAPRAAAPAPAPEMPVRR
ncbi:DHA2 family efflux MFS transporter permease subunit [Actinomadura darangshiensis]|uniref:DHA2 family efflux MFS transporter permease subunit n=1 Tax=Actinomadura darangshiensis TaxID=705336 RepID=A0A4R5APS3_9ACTN|nr:DHA2 family efflux MFS transporter permease subunit [Actinomadura darangshiensis]TDD75048.1 DHA2 family efflux MFS transporter permease subunit [Actinomadura darangshiensis]